MRDFEQLELFFRGIEHLSDTKRMILSELQSWSQVIARLDQRLLNLTDKQLERQVSPKKHRLIYLLGHLTVAHDKMRILLRMSDRLHPELDIAFLITLIDRKVISSAPPILTRPGRTLIRI
jgi:hypothetical protein